MTDDLLREARYLLMHQVKKGVHSDLCLGCDLEKRIDAHLASGGESVVAYDLWSNEMYIKEEGQVGVTHGRLFESPEAVVAFHEGYNKNGLKLGSVVRVTIEKYDAAKGAPK